jgi:lactate permease
VYEQVYEPVAGSLALSALVAAIPILVLFVLLAGVRGAAHDIGFFAAILLASQ